MTPILYSGDLYQAARFYNGVLGLYVTDYDGGLVVMNNQIKLVIRHAERARRLPKIDVIIFVFDAQRLQSQLQLRRMADIPLPVLKTGMPPRFSVCDPDGNTVHYVEKRPIRPTHPDQNVMVEKNLVRLEPPSAARSMEDVSRTAHPPA